jgi:hypothetical protein
VVFSEKFSFLLSLLWAGRCTRKDFCGGTRREVDADRSPLEVCGGALVATIHKPLISGDADGTTTVTGGETETCSRAARSTYWLAEWRFPVPTLHALVSLWAAIAAAHRLPWWAAAFAHPTHALLPLIAAVEAFATVILVSLSVYAPISAATLAFRAGANLVISTPDAVPRAALGVSPTFPSQTPAIVGSGYPWYGGQRSS